MDYEQEYKKAFEAAKGLHDAGNALTKKQMEIVFPQLVESEDERIRKRFIEYFQGFLEGNEDCYKDGGYVRWEGLDVKSILAWLEKQKEQKPVQSDVEREYVRTLKSLISDFLRGKEEVDREYYQQIYDWLDGRHIEQKPAEINLKALLTADRLASAEMTGRLKERSEILENPEKYGLQKSAEWSEEDEDMLNSCISSIEEAKENRYVYKETDGDTSYDHEITWLKSLRSRVGKESLQSWKPTEEQMKWLKDVIETVPMTCRQQGPLESLYADLQKLL